MHISRVHLRSFKRFHDLTLEIPDQPRLVVLCGPNGAGKSSLIDAFRLWHGGHGSGEGWFFQPEYHQKAGETPIQAQQAVEVEFSEGALPSGQDAKKIIYARSAYRHQADFQSSAIQRTNSLLDAPKSQRMIDPEAKVADNYQRLVAATFDDVFSGAADDMNVADLRDARIGTVRDAMLRLFPDLELQGPGDPMGGGTFYFRKGSETHFHYKNLSGGEKAAFDLILDLILKSGAYDDTVYCIDEPELHLNTRVQAGLLDLLLDLTPPRGQLWVATHSIGMMRRADQLYRQDPEAVAFIDFEGHNFDEPITLTPVRPTRDLWDRVLRVALDDLADLVAPDMVVLCEGRPASALSVAKAEFDARCYRKIFAQEFPRADFVSVGNVADVADDRVELGRTIQALVSGTKVIRVVDRDLRSGQEVADLLASGVRVLGRRHLEAYLLDEEVLTALAVEVGQPDRAGRLVELFHEAIQSSITRGNDIDDYKSAAGEFYTKARQLLALTGGGSTAEAFLADTLSPLVRPGMAVYQELRSDVFGPE